MRSTDPRPTVTVAFLDLHKNYEQLGAEVVPLTSDWQMHYVVIDLKPVHVGHSIRREDSRRRCSLHVVGRDAAYTQ